MEWKKNLAIWTVFACVAFGILYAISGATPNISGTQSRWAGATAGSITTEGGNISAVNIASLSLTDRWTAFFGNVTGTIVLGNNTNTIFNWTFAAAAGGKICIATNASLGFTTPIAADPATVNTAFGLGTTADNATLTFSGTCASLSLSTGSVAAPAKITHKGFSTYLTCAITSDGATNKNTTSFCTSINGSGINYLNNAANYEIMAPTTPGTGTEAYYFYAELS